VKVWSPRESEKPKGTDDWVHMVMRHMIKGTHEHADTFVQHRRESGGHPEAGEAGAARRPADGGAGGGADPDQMDHEIGMRLWRAPR
jgi:hypothetical protein